jgi:alpha-L-glutamate ligase-like protein
MRLFKKLRLINKLSDLGILGINQRNVGYISEYNQRCLYPLVDNKINTKKLAIKAGIHVPELYGVISIEHQSREIMQLLNKHIDFVIKPAHGSGGDGVIVIIDQYDGLFKKSDGRLINNDDLQYHISNILSGIYSLGGKHDKVMVEYRIKMPIMFADITYQGVPDIRIIVFKGYPIMAMLRLPTHQSVGRANLHHGAIGVGIDITTGNTLGGVWNNARVQFHPDTRKELINITIQDWEQCLLLASQCYHLTGLGYLGVDIVFDKNLGPLILEINARPGLNIQIANNSGLLPRLKVIESLSVEHTLMEKIKFVKEQL